MTEVHHHLGSRLPQSQRVKHSVRVPFLWRPHVPVPGHTGTCHWPGQPVANHPQGRAPGTHSLEGDFCSSVPAQVCPTQPSKHCANSSTKQTITQPFKYSILCSSGYGEDPWLNDKTIATENRDEQKDTSLFFLVSRQRWR